MKYLFSLVLILISLALAAEAVDSSLIYTHGGEANFQGRCLALTPEGSILLGGEISNNRDRNCFIAALNDSLIALGSVDFGGAGWDDLTDVCVDDSFGIYLAGTYTGSITLGETTLQAQDDVSIYLAKLSPQGEWLGAITVYGSFDNIYCDGLEVDKNGHIYLAGSFDRDVNFTGQALVSQGGFDTYLAKLDPLTGEWLWSVRAGGSSDEIVSEIKTDREGNTFIIGFFSGTATFGNVTFTSRGDQDCFAAKLDKGGNWLWVKQFGADGDDYGGTISFDADGNCYLILDSGGITTIGKTSYDHDKDGDFMLYKLDRDGKLLWTRQADLNMPSGMGLDHKGNIFVTGRIYGEGGYGSQKIKSNGSEDIYFLKLDPQGDPLWLESTGAWSSDISQGLVVDPQGNCYVTGYFSGTVSFGPHQRTATNGDSMEDDIFLYKIPANK